MINIIKKHTSESIKDEYDIELNPQSSYNSMRTNKKNKVRQILIKEQGRICCYCMSRIAVNNTRIEHWASQSQNKDVTQDYNNLLGSCHGNKIEGNQQQSQSVYANNPPSEDDKLRCDPKKGSYSLKFNPSNQCHDMDKLISYSSDGTITSPDHDFNKQLNEVLNLNYSLLKEERANKLKIEITFISRLKSAKKLTKEALQKRLDKKLQKDNNRFFEEFCGVPIYFLKNKLQK